MKPDKMEKFARTNATTTFTKCARWMNNLFPDSDYVEFEGAASAFHGGESKLMTARPGTGVGLSGSAGTDAFGVACLCDGGPATQRSYPQSYETPSVGSCPYGVAAKSAETGCGTLGGVMVPGDLRNHCAAGGGGVRR